MHVTEIDCSKTYDFSQKPTPFEAIYQSNSEIVLEQSRNLYSIQLTTLKVYFKEKRSLVSSQRVITAKKIIFKVVLFTTLK